MAVLVGTMQVTISIAIIQVPISVAIMQVLRFCCNYVCGTFHLCNYVFVAIMQVKVSQATMWVTIFIENMHVSLCCQSSIMQVVFSAVQYAHDYFYCNCAGDCFCCSYVCDSFK